MYCFLLLAVAVLETSQNGIDLKIDAKAPFTFSIVDEAGEEVFTTTAEHYEESGIKQKLSKGHYWLSMSCDDGYDLKVSIE